MIYLAQSLYNPAVKPFTAAAGFFSNAQALGNVFVCMCMTMRITVQEVNEWPDQPPADLCFI